MKDIEISDLIKKANESLGAAEQLLKSGYPDYSASRLYYAVISAFGREFIKNGLLPATLHHYISEAFDIRQTGDYGAVGSVGEETARILIDQTKELIKTIEEHLKNKGYEL